MRNNVKDKLLPDEKLTEEFGIFLRNYFGLASDIDTKKNQIIYGNEITSREELVVEYYGKNNKNHSQTEIKSIYLVDKNNSKLLESLEKESRKALATNNGRKIERRFLFSPFEVKGNYRFEDEFQIFTVPENAPKLDDVKDGMYEDHPFIMEFSYSKSDNVQIDNYRREKRSKELILILNAFLRRGITYVSNNAYNKWVTTNYHPSKVIYAQIGYKADNEKREKDQYGFTVYDKDKVFYKLESENYYSTDMIEENELRLPSNIDLLISKFNSLSEQEKGNFLRASYWKWVGSETFHISQSNAYIALANAIESLLPELTGERCSECNRHKEGPTKLFQSFVKDYYPDLELKYIKELYDLRSIYTHGKRLMLNDLGIRSFNRLSINESTKYRTMLQVVQMGMVNWLDKQQKN